jgi:hypothetical protein
MGMGGWSCTSAATRAVGHFFNSSGKGKRVVPRPPAWLRRKGAWPGWPSCVHWLLAVPRGGRRRKAVALPRPALSSVEEETHSCARGQVVIARPPVPTPSRRYRRSLVSKGCFAVPINVICVGIRSVLPKMRYRVVIDYVGGPLSHRGSGGVEAPSCFVGHDTCANLGN